MISRVKNFYSELLTKETKTIAICTHGYPIAVLTSLISKGSFDLSGLNNYPRPGVLVVIKDERVETVDFNGI